MKPIYTLLVFIGALNLLSCSNSRHTGPKQTVVITVAPDWMHILQNYGRMDSTWQACIAELSTTQKRADIVTTLEEAWGNHAPNHSLAAALLEDARALNFTEKASNQEVFAKLRTAFDTIMAQSRAVLQKRAEYNEAIIEFDGPRFGPVEVVVTSRMTMDEVHEMVEHIGAFGWFETYFNYELDRALATIDSHWRNTWYPNVEKVEFRNLGDTNYVDGIDTGATTDDDVLAAAMDLDEDDWTRDELRAQLNPLYSKFNIAIYQDQATGQYQWENGCRIGACLVEDSAVVGEMLRATEVHDFFPSEGRYLRLCWGESATNGFVSLYAVRIPKRNKKPIITSKDITKAWVDYDSETASLGVFINMDQYSSRENWKKMSGENIGKAIAMVVDGKLYSAPIVQSEILGGSTTVSFGSGEGALENALELEQVLMGGELPVPLEIVEEKLL
jgi:SecD/SecF fusion protein